jgi:hypothetical protein
MTGWEKSVLAITVSLALSGVASETDQWHFAAAALVVLVWGAVAYIKEF